MEFGQAAQSPVSDPARRNGDEAPAPCSSRAVTRARIVALGGHSLTLLVTASVFLLLNKPFYGHGSGYDEEFFTWSGWCVTKGLVPYRDFFELKPPVSFVTHALAIKLFGLENFGYKTFFAIFPLTALLLLQASLIARVGRLLAIGVVLAFLGLFMQPVFHDTGLTDSESIAVTYYVLGLAAFLWEGRFAKLTTAAGGFAMCCAVLSKEPIAAIVVPTWLGMFFMRGKATRADMKFFAAHSLLGVAAFSVLLCAYMVPTGSMQAYGGLLRSYPRIFKDPQRSYCVALGIAHADDGFRVAWEHLTRVFFNVRTLGHLAPLAAIGAVLAFRRSLGLLGSVLMTAVAGLWTGVSTNCMWIHYVVMSSAGVLYVLVAGADSLGPWLRDHSKRLPAFAGVAALTLAAWQVAPMLLKESRAHYERSPWREPQLGLLAFIAEHTQPGDRIFTTGTPQLYARSDRLSAVVESAIIDEMIPSYDGATDEERLLPLYRQLVKNRPKVVFLDPEHEYRKWRHLRSLVFPFLRAFDYQPINDRLYLRR